jgi:hypothetical protein
VDSLLINLASGAIGALVGAFAAYRLQIRESQKLAKGAARAVYVELQTNLTTVQTARPGFPILGAFTRDTWQSEQARLATFLTAVDFMTVAYAYAIFPNGETALATIRRGGGDDIVEELAMLNVVARAVAEAMEVMNPLVLSPSERKRVLQIAAELNKGSEEPRSPAV